VLKELWWRPPDFCTPTTMTPRGHTDQLAGSGCAPDLSALLLCATSLSPQPAQPPWRKAGTKTRAQAQILANSYRSGYPALPPSTKATMPPRYLLPDHCSSHFPHDEILKTGSLDGSEIAPARARPEPGSQTHEYRIIGESGPDHDKIFTVSVFVGDQLKVRGQGPSKQHAQQRAAEAALALSTGEPQQSIKIVERCWQLPCFT